MIETALSGGFAQAPTDSARAFRAVLDALSRPGTVHDLTGATPPAPLSQAAGVMLLTLADATTPVHLAGAADTAAVRDWITFHTGAPLVDAADAVFALGTWPALQPVDRFAIGTPEYPDRAATLIVECDTLFATGTQLTGTLLTGALLAGALLTGPGIQGHARLCLPETTAFRANHALFPLGFDCFFTAGHQVAGLPRSTEVGDM